MPKKKVTIHTSQKATTERISFARLVSLLGAFGAIIATFLPWFSITFPAIKSYTIYYTPWNLGTSSIPVWVYMIPVILLVVIFCIELIAGKVINVFARILLLVLLSLTTIAMSMYMLIAMMGAQYLLQSITLPIETATQLLHNNVITQIGVGLYTAFVSSLFLLFGLLGEIKQQLSIR
jgi:hypothetical protein